MPMYGADIAQLRALAAQFERAADQLDTDRSLVGSLVRSSPWQGPDASRFRYDWDSAHAGRVAGAAASLRQGAQRLRANADEQEVTSAVDGGPAGGGTGGPGGANPGGPGANPDDPANPWGWWDTVTDVWGGYRTLIAPIGLATSIAGLGFLATSVRGTTQLSSLASALAWSPTYQTLNSAKQFVNFGATASKYLGWAGVGFNAIALGQEIAEGDVGGAVWAGAKTAIGVGALVAPPPANLVFAGVGAAIGIGEFVYQNWDTITDVAGAVGDFAGDVVSAGVDFAGDVVDAGLDFAGDVVEGIGDLADALWPW